MKKLLIASTALVATAGVAAADVSVSGNARMGLVYDSLLDGQENGITGLDKSSVYFNSRVRAALSMSSETDGGLSFGGSFDMHNAGAAAAGTSGKVWISGAFGKLSMGDVDGAAKAAVGNVSGVGYTGLKDRNNLIFVNSGTDIDDDSNNDTIYPTPSALYEFSTGAATFYVGVGGLNGNVNLGIVNGTTLVGISGGQAYSVGAKYTTGGFTLSAGYESLESVFVGTGGAVSDLGTVGQFIVGVDFTTGGFTGKARYGYLNATGPQGFGLNQFAVSGDYTTGATTFTGFVATRETAGGTYLNNYGIGAAYDLGGGASVKAGLSNYDTTLGQAQTADLGLLFTF